MNFPRLSRPVAFTLVELLLVIVIISLLASLLAPATQRVLARARSTQCVSQLRQLGHAINLYAQDNNQRFPNVEYLPSIPADPANPLSSLHDALLKYVQGDEKIFRCPRDPVRWPIEGASYGWKYPYGDDLVDAPKTWIFQTPIEKAKLLWDYDNVHADSGSAAKNVLYADGHVGGI